MHLVSEDGQVLEGGGQRHSEYPIHTEIMIARPDVGGVVHTYPPHAVALAGTGQALRPVSHAATFSCRRRCRAVTRPGLTPAGPVLRHLSRPAAGAGSPANDAGRTGCAG